MSLLLLKSCVYTVDCKMLCHTYEILCYGTLNDIPSDLRYDILQ